MRNAIPNFICPLDTDELAGLACEDEFNSRLMRVVKQQEKEKWALEVGPFPEEVLQTLPVDQPKLVINELDSKIPAMNSIITDLFPQFRCGEYGYSSVHLIEGIFEFKRTIE